MKSLAENDPRPISIPLMADDRRLRQGAWLLIGSLGIFFFSSMLLYVIYIYMRLQNGDYEQAPLRLPLGFLLSTVLLVGISLTLHASANAAAKDQSKRLVQLLAASIALAVAFLLVQSEGMWWLVTSSRRFGLGGSHSYAFTFFLAFVHALHVLGGMVSLVWIFVNALRGKYDHERYYAIRCCGLYWHFLDLVWLVMLVSFMVAAWLIQSRV